MKDALGSTQSLLVLGGGSDIALATARAMVAERTRRVILAARDPDKLAGAAAELEGAGATVERVRFDADDVDSHGPLLEELFNRHGDIDVVLVAFGLLGEQEHAFSDPAAALGVMRTNYVGAGSAMLAAAARLRAQGHGALVLLSSVAAERARRSSFVYGSTKAGIDAFAQGLGDELAAAGVDVIVVRPGMVRTKMTEGLEEAPFTTTADKVAEAIVDGIRRGAHTVWAPPVLRYVFAVLRHLPRPVFRRLDL